MCGRYTLSAPPDIVGELFEISQMPLFDARYNLAPTQEAAVVRVLEPGEPRRLDLLRWGLVPYWADDPAIGNRMINARAESVAEKPAYRFVFKKQRCLVPADGFYEWRKEGKGKQPYLIRRKDRRPFAFAGLWSRWQPKGAEPGEARQPLETFTIVTTGANERVSELHDRMPVILPPEAWELWLDPKVQDAARLTPLLAPLAGDDLELVRVSRAVNSPANDTADCIEPLVDEAPAQEPDRSS